MNHLQVCKSMEKMETMLNNKLQDNEDLKHEAEERDWERYQLVYRNKKMKAENDKEKKEKRQVLYGKFEENVKSLEKIKKQKDKKTITMVKNSEKLIMDLHDRNAKNIRKNIVEKNLNNLNKVLDNKDLLDYEFKERNVEIINRELNILHQSNQREANLRLKQSIIRDNNVLSHLDLERKSLAFSSHVDNLKSDSVLKMPDEEKKRIYKELRKEEEAKKRDELERLLDKK